MRPPPLAVVLAAALAALAAGLLLGAVLALLEQLRAEGELVAYVYEPDPAAGQVGPLLEEARRITAEAADDAR